MNVFDSSAVLALVFNEPGADLATRLMDADDALISSVNQAEVLGKLHDTGMPADEAAMVWRQLPLKVVPFSAEHAQLAGRLRPGTRALGLSLGDRCCLALAQATPGATVVTADRPWATLPDFNITLIR